MANTNEADLRFLCALPKVRIMDLKCGCSLVQRTGNTVDDLLAEVVVDRLRLAAEMHREAELALTRTTPSYRNAISRAYYSMYQTIRGIVFYTNHGDDYETHSELPKHLPRDFPAREYWENNLKNARLERNHADYEPYPRDDGAFEVSAKTVFQASQQLYIVAQSYLRTKGLNA
jgi:uncharacterized protein (UPF0332 family)